jgi:polygalacturonase
MTLFLEKGAVLLGSTNLEDYPVLLPKNVTNSANCRSLLYAYEAEDLEIDGEGAIDGRCKLMDMPAELKKWGGTESKRPSLIRIFHSRNVAVRNVTFRNPCMWTQVYQDCDQLLIEHETVNAPPDCPNLDGMDICDSHDVVVRNCDLKCEDDAICLKSSNGRGLKNILVENNRIHCYRANAIKLGSATRGPVTNVEIISNLVNCAKYGGLCIESMDGSDINGFVVRNLDMYRVNNPIYIRLANRSGNPGSITNVLIENVRAYETGFTADPLSGKAPAPPSCSITGIPKAKIGGVRLKNCYIEMPGGLEIIPPAPAERDKEYPQSTMFGNVPAYGLYMRHAENVVLDHVCFGRYQPDARPWLRMDDATVKQTDCRDLEQIQPAATVNTH